MKIGLVLFRSFVPILLAIAAQAQDVVNAASFARPGMPNHGIARGSIFTLTIFGTVVPQTDPDLGPRVGVQASNYPLPSSQGLGGTSIQVTVAGQTVDALMLYAQARQVSAILPSATPAGTGTLRVVFNGQEVRSSPIKVVERAPGIFAVNQEGIGPGAIQVVDSRFNVSGNTLFHSARPGQAVVLWGTGIGPVSGNEAAGPLPGNQIPADFHVWVGGKDAVVQYAGRSGCCAGVDQINFIVPAGIEGCYVPVAVQIGNFVSNYVSMSISASGDTCSLPFGISSAELDAARARGNIRLGNVFLTTGIESLGPGGAEFWGISTAQFYNYPVNDFGTYDQFSVSTLAGLSGTLNLRYRVTRTVAVGSCTVSNASPTGVALDRALDVGPLTVGGTAMHSSTSGSYFGGPQYGVVSNGGGGSGSSAVGPFQVAARQPQDVFWTNEFFIPAVDRAQGVLVTWSGGDPNGFVYIIGWVEGKFPNSNTTFTCLERTSARSLFVPPAVTLALPESKSDPTLYNAGPFLELMGISPVRFDAPGLDAGIVTIANESLREVDYK